MENNNRIKRFNESIENDTFKIKQPTDIGKLLSWAKGQMLERKEETKGERNIEKWEAAIEYITKLSEQVKKDGFGK